MSDEKNRRLFGTDGIRGEANSFPMTPDITLKVGQAMGYLLRRNHRKNHTLKVVIGKDTRLSGYMIEQALASGLNSMGINVLLVGPLPTPAIGFLTINMRADAGIVISASHNAYKDNGIKIFSNDGFKLDENMEKEIEDLVLNKDLNQFLPLSQEIGRSRRIDDATGRYVVYVKNTFPLRYSLEGLRVVLDTANGAAYKVAPKILEELGAEVITLGADPDGRNINDKSGALYPQRVASEVVRYRADVGISLDGDADRVIMVDEKGQMVNGDHILAICALDMAEQKALPQNTVVATQMSNFGLDQLMKKNGINVIRTDVGDRNVVEEMRRGGFAVGGEQSGHIIFLNHTTTGDGLVASLSVLAVMMHKKQALSELNSVMEDVPQVLINTRVQKRKELDQIPGYPKLVKELSENLKGVGRIFVRFSGTEPLVRVLVEGPNRRQIAQYAEEVASLLQRELA